MRKRQVGNYLKKYPHVYEMFQNNIRIKNVSRGFVIGILLLLAFFALIFWVLGDKSGGMFFVIVLTPVVILLLASGSSEMISVEELELMERDLAGKRNGLGDWYSMEESFLIGFYRIPRKGLTIVYLEQEISSSRHGFAMVNITGEFYYEDGTHLSAGIRKSPEDWNYEDFVRLVRRYDNSVKIYKHKRLKENMPLFVPFQRLMAQEPYVRRETLEELSELSPKGSLWRMKAKSRDRYDGNQEVEVTLYGTVLTWLLYLTWLCGIFFLLFYSLYLDSEAMVAAVILAAGICYYLIFIKSAGKLAKEAKEIFYKSCG